MTGLFALAPPGASPPPPPVAADAILAHVARLLDRGWTQGATARDAMGRPLVSAADRRAVAWDLRGALLRAIWDLGADYSPDRPVAVEALVEAARDRVPARGEGSSLCALVRFNDSQGRQRGEVLQVVASARARLRKGPRLSAAERTLPLPGLTDAPSR